MDRKKKGGQRIRGRRGRGGKRGQGKNIVRSAKLPRGTQEKESIWSAKEKESERRNWERKEKGLGASGGCKRLKLGK